MPSSLRSQLPNGTLIAQGDTPELPPTNWTPIPRGDWAIFVAAPKVSVKIQHYPCNHLQWWGPLFHKTDNCGEVCAVCRTEIPVDVEDYLLKAWELYVF
jgi:hypothetical protein